MKFEGKCKYFRSVNRNWRYHATKQQTAVCRGGHYLLIREPQENTGLYYYVISATNFGFDMKKMLITTTYRQEFKVS